MKRFKNNDTIFIALAVALSVCCIGYACATRPDARFIDIRTLATKINTSDLTPTESKRLEKILNTQTSPCGDDVTLAESLFNSSHCPLAPLAGKFVVEKIEKDFNEAEIADAYLMRYAKLKGAGIPVDGSPEKGAENPAITFVVFTDFLCPYCGRTAEKMDDIVRSLPEKVAFIHKNFPLSSLHPEAELAARAAFAAGVQGKFWEMHDVLFSAMGELSREKINIMAEGLGLDMDQFEADISSTAATAAIESDIELGKKLGITGTPTIFINGRKVESGYRGIEERLREELLRAESR